MKLTKKEKIIQYLEKLSYSGTTEITSNSTIGEYSMWLLRNTEVDMLKITADATIGILTNIHKVELRELNNEVYKKSYMSMETRSRFKSVFLKYAKKKNYLEKLDGGTFETITRKYILNYFIESKPTPKSTIHQYVAYLLVNNKINKRKFDSRKTTTYWSFFSIVAILGDFLLEELNMQLLKDILEEEYGVKAISHKRQYFVKFVISEALSCKLIDKKSFYYNSNGGIPIRMRTRFPCIQKDIVNTNDVTVYEYICYLSQNGTVFGQDNIVLNLTIEKYGHYLISKLELFYVYDAICGSFPKMAYDTVFARLNWFKKKILSKAVEDNLVENESINIKYFQFRREIESKFEYQELSPFMSFGSLILHVVKNTDNARVEMSSISSRRIIEVLEGLGSIPLNELSGQDITDCISGFSLTRDSSITLKSKIKKAFLMFALESKLIGEKFFRLENKHMLIEFINERFTVALQKEELHSIDGHLKIKSCLNHERVYFGDYILHELFRRGLKDVHYINFTRLMPFLYTPIEDIKEDIKEASKFNKMILNEVFDLAIVDKKLSFDPYVEKQEEVHFDGDTWKLLVKGKRRQFSFGKIKDVNLKNSAKAYVRFEYSANKSVNQRIVNDIYKGLEKFLDFKKIKIGQFTNAMKKEWLLWLKDNYNSKKLFYSCKGFFKYCIEVDNGVLKKNFTLNNIKNPYVEIKNKRSAFEKHEIDLIVESIKEYEHKVFTSIMILLMLTGKRKSEILNLKRDCIFGICDVKYLRYINEKTNKEDKVQLYKLNSNQKDNLFGKDAVVMIEELVVNQIEKSEKYLELCESSERDFLFLTKMKQRSNRGFKYGKFTDSLYSTEIKRFKIQNRIKFKLEVHRFRHTLASKIIRMGHGIEVAAKMLGNHPKTVAITYESNVLKSETVKLKTLPMTSILGSVEQLNNMDNTPKLLEKVDDTNHLVSVYGGWCSSDDIEPSTCKYYKRLFGKNGCLGCASLAVSSENLQYYQSLKDGVLEEIERAKGIVFLESAKEKLKLVDNALNLIKKGA